MILTTGTSSNGPESSIKIELGSKEAAESYYNRKDNSINNDYCKKRPVTARQMMKIMETYS